MSANITFFSMGRVKICTSWYWNTMDWTQLALTSTKQGQLHGTWRNDTQHNLFLNGESKNLHVLGIEFRFGELKVDLLYKYYLHQMTGFIFVWPHCSFCVLSSKPGILQRVSGIWTCLTLLSLVFVVQFCAWANFCYCQSASKMPIASTVVQVCETLCRSQRPKSSRNIVFPPSLP